MTNTIQSECSFQWPTPKPSLFTVKLTTRNLSAYHNLLKEWSGKCIEKVKETENASPKIKKSIINTQEIINTLMIRIDLMNQQIYVVYDKNRVIQGIASKTEAKNQVSITHLTGSPDAVCDSAQDKKVKNISCALIKHIAFEMHTEQNGRSLEVCSTPDAFDFYKEIGFKNDASEPSKFTLPAGKIAEFLQTSKKIAKVQKKEISLLLPKDSSFASMRNYYIDCLCQWMDNSVEKIVLCWQKKR